MDQRPVVIPNILNPMENIQIDTDLKSSLEGIFLERNAELFGKDTPYVASIRKQAFGNFQKLGFPHTRLEKWRGTDLSKSLSVEYEFVMDAPGEEWILKISLNAKFHISKPSW